MEHPTLDQQVETIEHNLTNHKPSDDQIARIERVREHAKEFAKTVAFHCLGSREKSLAQTKIEEACMWAVASIAREVY